MAVIADDRLTLEQINLICDALDKAGLSGQATDIGLYTKLQQQEQEIVEVKAYDFYSKMQHAEKIKLHEIIMSDHGFDVLHMLLSKHYKEKDLPYEID
jgi:hypothetical protein